MNLTLSDKKTLLKLSTTMRACDSFKRQLVECRNFDKVAHLMEQYGEELAERLNIEIDQGFYGNDKPSTALEFIEQNGVCQREIPAILKWVFQEIDPASSTQFNGLMNDQCKLTAVIENWNSFTEEEFQEFLESRMAKAS